MTSYRNIALAFISAALSLGFKDEPAGERLVDVSILNYGTPTRVNQIREWNHYKDEYIPEKSSSIVKREEEKVESTAAHLFLDGKRHFERSN